MNQGQNNLKIELSYPVYLMYGLERYNIEQMLETIKNQLNDSYRQLNVNVIDLQNYVDVDSIINCCESVSFMDSYRIVVVKNIEFFQNNKSFSKDDIKKIKDYLENPCETTKLIFLPQQVDKRTELYKYINKKYFVYESQKLDKIKFFVWIEKKFKEKGIFIDNVTKNYFVENSGYLFRDSSLTLLDIENEIDKVCLNLNSSKINIDDIQLCMSNTKESDIFKLIDSIFMKDSQASYNMIKNNKEYENQMLFILSMIARQLSILIKINMLKTEVKSMDNIAKILSLHKFVLKKSLNQIRYFTVEELLNLYNICSDIDYRIKKGQIKDSIAVDIMINKICENV